MITLSLYVGLSDRHGRPLPADRAHRLCVRAVRTIEDSGATILASGRLTGTDEEGTPEPSVHYLIAFPSAGSVLALLRDLAGIVRRSGQRSFGVVGWSLRTTIVPTDSGAADAFYLQGQGDRGRIHDAGWNR